jgi:hypothetical protein
MPITRGEREKLRTHTFSEDKKGEFSATHMVAPEIRPGNALALSLVLLASNAPVFALNIPGSLILAFYIALVIGAHSILWISVYSLAFFILWLLVAAPLSALSKARLSGMKASNPAGSMLMSLAYLEPVVVISYLGVLMIALHKLYTISLYWAAFIVLLVIATVLYIANLNVSIAIQLMYGKRIYRNTALNRSWLFLSGQSLRMMLINTAAFLPLIVAILAGALFAGTLPAWYLVPVLFVIADLCTSWWQACTSHVYSEISSKIKPMQYSRL